MWSVHQDTIPRAFSLPALQGSQPSASMASMEVPQKWVTATTIHFIINFEKLEVKLLPVMNAFRQGLVGFVTVSLLLRHQQNMIWLFYLFK